MALSVPQSAHHGLKVLTELEDAAVERLIAILEQTPAAGSSSKLAAAVASRLTEVRPADTRAIVRSLVNLHLGMALFNRDASSFSREICEGLQEIEELQPISHRVDSVLCPRLERLLQMRSPFRITTKSKNTIPRRSEWREREPVTISAEEQAREARIERTRQRVKELQKDPEFLATLRSIEASVDVSTEMDLDLIRRLDEGEFRREATLRRYGHEFGKMMCQSQSPYETRDRITSCHRTQSTGNAH
jgi:hypothetical protein